MGCLKTVVPIPTEDVNIPRLLSTAESTLVCHFSTNTENPELNAQGVRGHQFFMGIVPFGSIESPSGAELTQHYIRQEGGILGMKCVQDGSSPNALLLMLQVEELSLSGYDFIFFRKPSATVIIRGELFRSESGDLSLIRSCTARGEEHEYRQYAFSKELSGVFDAAWRKSMSSLMRCILEKGSLKKEGR